MGYARAEGRFPTLTRADGVEHWLVPVPSCPRCSGPVAPGVPLCAYCSAGAFEGSPLTRVVAATLYLSPDSRFKWPHTREITELKATGAHAESYAEVLASLAPPCDLVVPVPGSGPAPAALAEALGGRLGVPVGSALHWIRPVARQKSLKREARFVNVKDALVAADIVRGARVLLVDDVAASCATLMDAARAMIAAGAQGCVAAVAARESNTHVLEQVGAITPS